MSQNNTQIAFTKHARERMQLRVISEDMVISTIRRPDKTFPEDDGDTKFIRWVDGVNLHVVCKRVVEEDKWLVKSTWVRGEDDNGNRVDRYGNYRGRVRREVPRAPRTPRAPRSQASIRLSVDAMLFIVLIVLTGVLIYFIAR